MDVVYRIYLLSLFSAAIFYVTVCFLWSWGLNPGPQKLSTSSITAAPQLQF
jgi:hypothetical protein